MRDGPDGESESDVRFGVGPISDVPKIALLLFQKWIPNVKTFKSL